MTSRPKRKSSRPPPKPVQSAAERQELLDFARFVRGDPLLTGYEEFFAASMDRLGRVPNAPPLTAKQRAVFEQISRKIGFNCEPAPLAVADDEAFDEYPTLDQNWPDDD